MIDIHSHILPAVDDGAVNMEQTKNMLRIAFEEGIRTIIATPHYAVGCINPTKDELEEKLKLVREEALKINETLTLYLGNEVFYSEEVIRDLRNNKALTLAGTRYVLVRFPKAVSYKEMKTGLHRLLIYGYLPILSHMEYYPCLFLNYESIEELIRLGVYMQMNSSSIIGPMMSKQVKYCKKLLEYQIIHMIASDSHSDHERRPKMKAEYQYMKRKYGELADRLFSTNLQTLLKNQLIY